VIGVDLFARNPIAPQLFVLTTRELALIGIEDGACLKRVAITASCCTCCAVAGDGHSCAISTMEGTVRIVDVVTFAEVGSIFFDQMELHTVASYDSGKHFVVTSADGRIGLFDLRKMVTEPALKVGKKPLLALSVNETIGKACVAGCHASVPILDFE
jgi:WD40 repeat protein